MNRSKMHLFVALTWLVTTGCAAAGAPDETTDAPRSEAAEGDGVTTESPDYVSTHIGFPAWAPRSKELSDKAEPVRGPFPQPWTADGK